MDSSPQAAFFARGFLIPRTISQPNQMVYMVERQAIASWFAFFIPGVVGIFLER